MHEKYPHIFTPLRVKNTVFRNRIFAAPNMLVWANWDGSPSLYMINYFAEKAKGGTAMVTMGDTTVDEVYGGGIPRHVKLIPENVNHLAELARAIKAYGAVASFELNHPGNAGRNANGEPVYGPSEEDRSDGVHVHAMDEKMIQRTVQRYAECAALLKRAGWDMVILHGAHGWLLGQFLSPHYNRRTDEYGGSLENRARFPLMVIDAIRKACGPNFLIDYRVSGEEFLPDGLTLEESVAFGKMIDGKVDMIHVSTGLDRAPQMIITHPNSYMENGCNVKYAEAFKKAGIRCPITAIGGINDPEMAEEILASGKADAVAMCRQLIADPHWVNKVREGRLNEIHHCLRCTNCLAEMHPLDQFKCDVNPRTGHETIYLDLKPTAARAKTVYVAGGGPGGMTAAITAAERGHRVTILEKSGRLGGALNYTDHDVKFKKDLHQFKETLIARIAELPIIVRLNTEVTPDLLEAERPDAVLIAVGAEPVYPPIPGMTREIMTAFEAYSAPEKVGESVVLIGGGLVGAETAIFLADLGKKVTVVEMTGQMATEANMHHGLAVRQMLDKTGVVCMVNTRCTGVEANGIHVTGPDGTEQFIAADTVLLSAGYRPRTAETDSLLNICDEFAIIGDCHNAGRVKGAVHEGYGAALSLG